MNITLSADADLIRKAREYAKRHHSSLNSLIRHYLEQITNEMDKDRVAAEFERLCTEYAGESTPEYHFNRAKEYERR
ncbi:MAG: DUF6364 family protein [Spirochaetaceae bacterium]|nr:DUF6364 family protein [Spirochaetaceae bacterium]MCF7939793.1 DUF6364 family protein [Spirochaetales bacterium]